MPKYEEGKGWHETGKWLIPPPGEQYWSDHSERNFLTAHGGIWGIPKQELDRLGRWRTKENTAGSEDYQRGFRQIVRQIQRQIVAAWISKEKHADVKELEDEIRGSYATFLKGRGIGYTKAEKMSSLLKTAAPQGPHPAIGDQESDKELDGSRFTHVMTRQRR